MTLNILLAALPVDAQGSSNADTRQALSEEKCSASFNARLAEARAAIASKQAYDKELKKMDWWSEHCRFLSPLEIGIRKLDDPNSFVCDTQKGRPPGLTTKFVLEHGVGLGYEQWQTHSEENLACQSHDPISLWLVVPPEPATEEGDLLSKRKHQLWQMWEISHVMAIRCYGSKGTAALKCKENIDKATALVDSLKKEISKLSNPAPSESSASP